MGSPPSPGAAEMSRAVALAMAWHNSGDGVPPSNGIISTRAFAGVSPVRDVPTMRVKRVPNSAT